MPLCDLKYNEDSVFITLHAVIFFSPFSLVLLAQGGQKVIKAFSASFAREDIVSSFHYYKSWILISYLIMHLLI